MNDEGIPEARDFFALTDTYLSPLEQTQVRAAYALARQEHGEDRRMSGELFFTHPLTVARYLAEYQADAASLASALLHDVAEDTKISVAEIEAQFGKEVGRLVDGLTKFAAVTKGPDRPKLSKEQEQSATLYRLFEVMTADWRVGIIKLFDRLHNMRTIRAVPIESQRRKAKETLAVYAPLANRLGLWALRNELGDIAVSILHPEAHGEILARLQSAQKSQQRLFREVSRDILERLQRAGLTADVQFCPEHLFSVYDNARNNGEGPFRIDDLLRVVVELKDTPSCYLALGEIHDMWKPVPGKFDDYIAQPRHNLYSALHTTVNHSSGQQLKVRFRTQAMNLLSEIGILARWVQLGMPLWSPELAERVDGFWHRIRDSIQLEPQDPDAGVQRVVEDIFPQQIQVRTPIGQIKQLPIDATPVDFAYAIHTDIGDQCAGAYVNGERAPLNRPLKDGDRVFIIKRENHTPHRTWLEEDLGYTKTRVARARVRRWFRRLPEQTAVAEGRGLVDREMKLLGRPDFDHTIVAALHDYDDLTAFYHDVGRADVLPTAVATRVLAELWDTIPSRDIGQTVCGAAGETFVITNAGGRRLHLCRHCRPRPFAPLLGYIRADKAVTVHVEGCGFLPTLPPTGRMIKLGWGAVDKSQVRIFRIKIDVFDRPNLVLEIAEFLRDEQVNIHALTTDTDGANKSIVLELELFSARQAVRILHRVGALVNVYDVYHYPDDMPGVSA